jgi:hypothetical protein
VPRIFEQGMANFDALMRRIDAMAAQQLRYAFAGVLL